MVVSAREQQTRYPLSLLIQVSFSLRPCPLLFAFWSQSATSLRGVAEGIAKLCGTDRSSS